MENYAKLALLKAEELEARLGGLSVKKSLSQSGSVTQSPLFSFSGGDSFPAAEFYASGGVTVTVKITITFFEKTSFKLYLKISGLCVGECVAYGEKDEIKEFILIGGAAAYGDGLITLSPGNSVSAILEMCQTVISGGEVKVKSAGKVSFSQVGTRAAVVSVSDGKVCGYFFESGGEFGQKKELCRGLNCDITACGDSFAICWRDEQDNFRLMKTDLNGNETDRIYIKDGGIGGALFYDGTKIYAADIKGGEIFISSVTADFYEKSMPVKVPFFTSAASVGFVANTCLPMMCISDGNKNYLKTCDREQSASDSFSVTLSGWFEGVNNAS